MSVEPTIGLALLAGFLSFVSPCVLPLVPAYIGYMSGHATQQASGGRGRFATFLHGLAFVLGFSIFFVGFGLLTAAASSFLFELGVDIPTILTRLGGVAVIFFGLYVMKALNPFFRRGLAFSERLKANPAQAIAFTLLMLLVFFVYFLWVFESPIGAAVGLVLTLLLVNRPLRAAESVGDFWYRLIKGLQTLMASDTRQLGGGAPRNGYAGSLAMGLVFAAGWTPCIGPIYGAVLTLATTAANEGTSLLPAASMLTAYSAGLGIPFLITALALNQTSGVMRGLKRNMRKVEYVSGGLLIFIGVLILSGGMTRLTANLSSGEFADFSTRFEECTVASMDGRIRTGSWSGCVSDGAAKLDNRVAFAAIDLGPEPLFQADPDFDAESVPVGLEVGQRAPNFVTTTPEGDPLTLEDFRGQIVLINFWAEWCGPCRNEMPMFESVYNRFNARGFTVVAVNVGDSPEVIDAFVQEVGVTFPIAMDRAGEIDDAYSVVSYPTSILIDGNGVIVAKKTGELLESELLSTLERFETTGG